ncbi:MAG: hypothetical protein ACFFDW_08470 [Candidatus Thorarchaeota archaeon]
MTINEIDEATLAENFYNAIRGFIVIEESGLPKYIEFLTEEKIDVILLAGLLSSLQALSEVVSEERIKSIETSNSKFIFELRSNFFFVFWIEKSITDIENYEPIIMKIISRFEGFSEADIKNAVLISNLTETPEYEKIGRRLVKIRSTEARYFDAYKKLKVETKDGVNIDLIANELSGIDALLIISDNNKEEVELIHSEFPRGTPVFKIDPFVNFIVGLRKSIKNLDPGKLEEVTTQNYRFIIRDGIDFFYVFEVIRGLAKTEKISETIHKIMSRYEGLRRKDISTIQILKNIQQISEHELLGQLSMEMRERQSDSTSMNSTLKREVSKIAFGDLSLNWMKEEEQFYSFMDVFKEVFLVGILDNNHRFFISKKTSDINDWIKSINEMEYIRLNTLVNSRPLNEIVKLTFGKKIIELIRLKEKAILFVMLDEINPAIDRYMLRLQKILEKICIHLH